MAAISKHQRAIERELERAQRKVDGFSEEIDALKSMRAAEQAVVNVLRGILEEPAPDAAADDDKQARIVEALKVAP